MNSSSALFLPRQPWSSVWGEQDSMRASDMLAALENGHHAIARRLERLMHLRDQTEPSTRAALLPHARHLREALILHREALEDQAATWLMWADLGPYRRALKHLQVVLQQWVGELKKPVMEQTLEVESRAFHALSLHGWRCMGDGLLLLQMCRNTAKSADLPLSSESLDVMPAKALRWPHWAQRWIKKIYR